MSIKKYILTSPSGDQVHISNCGARILQWHTLVDDKSRNIVLGYPELEDYLTDTNFMGAIVGPYANRIKQSTFSIAGISYQLDANIEPHHLHGGRQGIGEVLWQCQQQSENSLTLICQLKDGYNGYPGAMTFSVTYQLTGEQVDGSELSIKIKVNSDKTTVAGPTAHPYFNLSGNNCSAEGHQLQVFSSYFTQVDKDNVPTGELVHVSDGSDCNGKGTLDFRKTRRLSTDSKEDILDHNFLIKNKCLASENTVHAILVSPDNKLQLEVDSNYPALQVYTGQHLQTPFTALQGICLEPQFCPDSPNQSEFPFRYTTPQQPLKTEIVYRLVNLNSG